MQKTHPIVTTEKITDPHEYAKANIKQDDLNEKNWRIVVGPDYHLIVKNSIGIARSTEEFSGTYEVSPELLGPLYAWGKGSFEVGEGFIDYRWYQSPEHLNSISERLGLEPGNTILKAVISDYMGERAIEKRRYVTHFGKGELPESVNSEILFKHDRKEDHAAGIFFIPENVTQRVISLAGRSRLRPDVLLRPSSYDRLTGRATRLAKFAASFENAEKLKTAQANLHKEDRAVWDGYDNRLIRFLPRGTEYDLRVAEPGVLSSRWRAGLTLANMIIDTYLERKPLIEQLIAEDDLENNKVVAKTT